MKKSLLILVSFLVACGSNSTSSENMMPIGVDHLKNIDVIVSSTETSFAGLIGNVKFIPIETDSINPIGAIDKIISYESEYYVLDRRKSRSLRRIDQNGKFLNNIGRLGRGPGEYLEPTDFIVNSSGVILLDQYSRSLLFYDHNGNNTDKISLDYVIYEISGMGDKSLIFAIAGDNSQDKSVVNSEFLIINTNGKLISQGIKNKYQLNFTSGYKSFLSANHVTYFRPMHNIVYSISQDSIQTQYKITIKDSPLPDDYEKACSGDYEKFMEKYKGKYSYFSGKLIETNDHILFTSEGLEFPYIWTIYDKITGKTISGPIEVNASGNHLTAKDMIIMGLNNCLTVRGNEIVGYLNPYYLTVEGFVNEYPALKNITEYDNPVIFHFDLNLNNN